MRALLLTWTRPADGNCGRQTVSAHDARSSRLTAFQPTPTRGGRGIRPLPRLRTARLLRRRHGMNRRPFATHGDLASQSAISLLRPAEVVQLGIAPAAHNHRRAPDSDGRCFKVLPPLPRVPQRSATAPTAFCRTGVPPRDHRTSYAESGSKVRLDRARPVRNRSSPCRPPMRLLLGPNRRVTLARTEPTAFVAALASVHHAASLRSDRSE